MIIIIIAVLLVSAKMHTRVMKINLMYLLMEVEVYEVHGMKTGEVIPLEIGL